MTLPWQTIAYHMTLMVHELRLHIIPIMYESSIVHEDDQISKCLDPYVWILLNNFYHMLVARSLALSGTTLGDWCQAGKGKSSSLVRQNCKNKCELLYFVSYLDRPRKYQVILNTRV